VTLKNLTVGTVLREISLAKNNIIDPYEFWALFDGDKTMMQIADIYQAYSTCLSATSAMPLKTN